MKKKFPKFKSNKELEKFLEQDLSDYLDKKNFRPVSFEFLPKDAKINMRFSQALLDAIKERADDLSISYQKYIRQVLEKAVL